MASTYNVTSSSRGPSQLNQTNLMEVPWQQLACKFNDPLAEVQPHRWLNIPACVQESILKVKDAVEMHKNDLIKL